MRDGKFYGNVLLAELAFMVLAAGCASEPSVFASGSEQNCVPAGQVPAATQIAVIRTGIEAAQPGATALPVLQSMLRPQQVAVAPGDVFVIDSGLRQLLRINVAQNAFLRIISLEERASGLAVDRLQNLYVALPGTRRVLQLTAAGTLVRSIDDPAARFVPVDVAVSEAGRIFVADAANARVLVFDRFGQVVDSIGERGASPNLLRSVDALAFGGDALYVLDATARRIFVFRSGEISPLVMDLGGTVSLPGAVAVDRWRRVFVTDRGDGRVFVFDTAARAAPVRLDGFPPVADLADIWIDDFGTLYVADAAAAAILTFRVPEPCR